MDGLGRRLLVKSAVLAGFGFAAMPVRAEPGRWALLTGSPATLNTLVHDAFKLGTVSGGFTHSTEFALVDRRGFIRGYYDAEEGESLAPLIAAIRRLAQEQA